MEKLGVYCAFFALLMSLSGYAQSKDLKSSIKKGEALYQVNCASCHMPKGEGLPGVYPPLTISERLKDKKRLVTVIDKGISGQVEIEGVYYNGMMPGFNLKNEEIADILNYVRNSFGNKLKEIKPEEIEKLIEKDHKQ